MAWLLFAVALFHVAVASLLPPLPISLQYFKDRIVENTVWLEWEGYIKTNPNARNALSLYSFDGFSINWNYSTVSIMNKKLRFDMKDVNGIVLMNDLNELVIKHGHISFEIELKAPLHRFNLFNIVFHTTETSEYKFFRYAPGLTARTSFPSEKVRQYLQKLTFDFETSANLFIQFSNHNEHLKSVIGLTFNFLSEIASKARSFHVSIHQPLYIPIHTVSSILFDYFPIAYRNIPLMDVPFLSGFQISEFSKVTIDRSQTSITPLLNGIRVNLKRVSVFLKGTYFWTPFKARLNNVDISGDIVLHKDDEMAVYRPRIENMEIKMRKVLPNVEVVFDNRWKSVGATGYLMYSAILSRVVKWTQYKVVTNWIQNKLNALMNVPLSFNLPLQSPVPMLQLNVLENTRVDIIRSGVLLNTMMRLPASQEIFYENLKITDDSLLAMIETAVNSDYVIAEGQYSELTRFNLNLNHETLNYFLGFIPIVVSKVLNNLYPIDLEVPNIMPGLDAHVYQLRFQDVSLSPDSVAIDIHDNYVAVSLRNINLDLFMDLLIAIRKPTRPEGPIAWYKRPFRALKYLFHRGVYHVRRLFSQRHGHEFSTHAKLDISFRLKSQSGFASSIASLCDQYKSQMIRDGQIACPINENSMGVLKVNEEGGVEFQTVHVEQLSIKVHTMEVTAFGIPAGQLVSQVLQLPDVHRLIAGEIQQRVTRTMLNGQRLIRLPHVDADRQMLFQLAGVIKASRNHVTLPLKLSIPAAMRQNGIQSQSQ